MKKNFIFLVFFCILLSAFTLKAQQPQLPDPSFETGWKWTNSPYHESYWEYQTDHFYTLNSLVQLKNEPRMATLTAFKEGNAQHLDNCIKLVSGDVPVSAEDIFLPGMVGTISQDFVDEFLKNAGKVAVASFWDDVAPHAMEGYYKYAPVNNDSALIDIGFYEYADEDPVFIAKKIIKQPVTNWTKFTIEIPEQFRGKYYNYIRVLFVASAGVNFDELQKCKGQKGSALWIDNISFNYELGIKQNLLSTLKAKAFPNPATEILNIELNENFAGTVMVYNLLGSLVMEDKMNGTECQLNISALTAGNYVYKLMNENTIFAQGKFVVTK
jgi:hypothetical protein